MDIGTILAIITALGSGLFAFVFVYFSDLDISSTPKMGLSFVGGLVVFLLAAAFMTAAGIGTMPGMAEIAPEEAPDGGGQPIVIDDSAESWLAVNVENPDGDTVETVDNLKITGAIPEAGESLDRVVKSVSNYESGDSVKLSTEADQTVTAVVNDNDAYNGFAQADTYGDELSLVPGTFVHKTIATPRLTGEKDIGDVRWDDTDERIEIDEAASDVQFTVTLGVSGSDEYLSDPAILMDTGENWSDDFSLHTGVDSDVAIEGTEGSVEFADSDEGDIYTNGSLGWGESIELSFDLTNLSGLADGDEIFVIEIEDLDDGEGIDGETGIKSVTVPVKVDATVA